MVSVIVPVYNVESYIERCLESIINQTHRNLEIIIVDDGSTDDSGAICDKYAKNDARIMVIHKNNGGLSSARNAGIIASVGDYLSFVDSDDYIDLQMIETLLNLVKTTDSQMGICSFKYVGDIASDQKKIVSPIKDELINGAKLVSETIWKDSATQVFWTIVCNKLYKRELFCDVSFPIGYVLEDLYVMPGVIERCEKVVCTSKELYFYFQHNNSILHSRVSQKLLDSSVVYLHLSDEYSKKGEYSGFFYYLLFGGVWAYKESFWNRKNSKLLKSRSDYLEKKYLAIKLFLSAWKKGRKTHVTTAKRFFYFEWHYLLIWLSRLFICLLL